MDTAASDFNPGSLFGVPLSAFPPGIKWKDARDMLTHVFSDMRARWVQDYLLFRVNPEYDAAILFDREKLSRAIPLTFSATSNERLSGGFSGTTVYLRNNVPAFSCGNIGAGITVESSFGTGGAQLVFPLANSFGRYIVNADTGAQLNLCYNKQAQTIEVTHLQHNFGGLWTSTLLWFNPEIFKTAWNPFTHSGDLDILQAALARSIVSIVQHDDNRLVSAAAENGKYPYRISDNCGEHFFKSVFCSYANSTAMMAMPVFADGHWTFSIPTESLTRMNNWAIFDRLNRLGICVPAPAIQYYKASISDEEADEYHYQVLTPETAQPIRKQPVNNSGAFVKIAPAAVPGSEREVSREAKLQKERARKVNARNIKKREAAARSNARRAERTRQRREAAAEAARMASEGQQ